MEEDRIHDEPMEEAPLQEVVVEETSNGDISEELQIPSQQLLVEELTPDELLEQEMLAFFMSEQPTPETPMEVDSLTEAPIPETPTTELMPGIETERPLSRRPPRWLQSTATQSKLHRALHAHRLESEIADYSMNREEIQEYGRLEIRRLLTGMGPPPPMDRAAQIEAHFNGDAPDSAKVNALLVPKNRLQVVRWNAAIRMRDFYEHASLEDLIQVTLPSEYETWKMEKEYSDLKEALGVIHQTHGEDERERDHRARMWVYNRPNNGSRRNLFRSRGYGSSFREVISADEEWPEEGWASAGLVQPDADFVTRFEVKMRMRPVLVRENRRQPR
ncbi:hypothetical protein H0G86_013122 [Trichoderma simmonsii]|uniref:Uncharacterized protein n=1 Tax=Trichoderma simmonsii TaxID=1491479 RepID=A0A8G0PMN7_9HYPO|nr:hypothetical protein H0G86_013122 [Trichoderma simmonsii]